MATKPGVSATEALLAKVKDGNLGLKSGHGFLNIAPADRPALLAYRDHAYARLSQIRTALGQAPGL